MSASLPAIPPDDGGPQPSLTASGHLPPKRNRTQLSCTQCRHAKLKCDRKYPCLHCVKKGRAAQCIFLAPATRNKPAESMQSRLRHLESLVKDIMTSQTPTRNTDSPDVGLLNSSKESLGGRAQITGQDPNPIPQATQAGTSTSSGQVVQNVRETTYVGATHWAAILDDIEEVKSYFNEAEPEDYTVNSGIQPDTSLLFSFEPQATKEELLTALPARGIVDKLIYRYFNSNSSTIYVIHKPTFQNEYKKFWANPSGTPIAWLAQLYALLSLATIAYLWAGEESLNTGQSPTETIRTFRSCCAQCLVLSKYSQPGQYTIEALILYMESEFLLSKDDQLNGFLLVGCAVRLALRVGLHRDATKIGGNFTPYQAELRRRIWFVLVQIDLLAGFHLGLPSMIQAVESDTEYPCNLKDEDFDEDTVEMPPGRPETDMTPMSYMICKGRIMEVFGKIAAQANRLSLLSYDGTMNLDRLLNESFAKIPPFLRYIPVGLAVTDSSETIMQRFNLVLLYHKSRCVLHRKYLIKERKNHEYAYSKKAGLDASLEILFYQSAIHEAVQPGGPLCRDKWYISSLPMHDFLLAGTIVSIQVMQMIDDARGYQNSRNTSERTQQEMITALQRSYTIWNESQNITAEAKKASAVVGFMLEKIKSSIQPSTGSDNIRNTYHIGGNEPNADLISELSMNDLRALGERQTSSTIRSRSTEEFDAMSPSNMVMQFEPESMLIPVEELGAMLDMTTNFDWDSFDSHLRPQHQLPDQSWPVDMFDKF